ncbi:MAG: hypothetical protein KGL11_02430 [Alphaproteobacteria bacterium]|nr:hypothetical protein [Alphaproteobacteria bacterium]
MRASRWILSTIAVVALAAPARAGTVQDWQNKKNYPARVVGVIWNGARLDANNPVQFGAWTISFEGRSHVAIYDDNPITRSIVIGGSTDDVLGCTNAVVGNRNCQFQLNISPKVSCEIVTYTGTGASMTNIESLSIPCPTALDL